MAVSEGQRLAEEFACPICLASPLVDPVTVQCGHSLDRACLVACLRRGYKNGCPVCREPMSRRTPGVSVLLQDAIARLCPTELRQRRERLMYEELEEGRANKAVLACLVKRLRDPEEYRDVGSLMPMLSLFVSVLTEGGHSPDNVSAEHALTELSSTVWTLLQRPPLPNSPEALQAALEAFVGDVDTLTGHVAKAGALMGELEGLTRSAISGCESLWSMLCPNTESPERHWHRLHLGVSLLENLVLEAVQMREQQRLTSGLLTSAAGVFLAILSEARSALAAGTSSTDISRAHIAALRSVGSLAVLVGHEKAVLGRVWDDLRSELVAAMHIDMGVAVAAAAARASGALLDAHICPSEALGSLLQQLLGGVHALLVRREVADDAASAQQLLALLGDVHRSVPEGAGCDAIARSVVGEGRFTTTCSIIASAGKAATVEQQHLPLGVLQAWEGVMVFLKAIPAADAMVGLLPWVESVVAFLTSALAASDNIEVSEPAIRVLGDVLLLASKAPGIASVVTSWLRQNPEIVFRACGTHGGCIPTERQPTPSQLLVQRCAQQLGLPFQPGPLPGTGPLPVFGGGSLGAGSVASWQGASTHRRGRQIIRRRARG